MRSVTRLLALLLSITFLGFNGLREGSAQGLSASAVAQSETSATVRANAPVALKVVTETLDIDANSSIQALTDGLLVLRYMVGLRGTALVQGAVGPGAMRDTGQIETHLLNLTTGAQTLDIDDNGTSDALTDGLLVIRYLLGMRGPALIQGAIATGAMRPSVTQIEQYMATLTASTPPQPTSYCQPEDKVVDVPWPPAGQTRPGSTGFANQVYSFRLTIPFTFNPPLNNNHLGFVQTAEAPGSPPTFRELTVSRSACDFHAAHGGYLLDTLNTGDPNPGFIFTVNNPGGSADINFQSGDVIYVSFRNYYNNNGTLTPTCPNGFCDFLFDFATPNRY